MISKDSIEGVNVEGQDVFDVVEMVKVLSNYIFQLVDTLVISIISEIGKSSIIKYLLQQMFMLTVSRLFNL